MKKKKILVTTKKEEEEEENIAMIAKLPYWQGKTLIKVSLYCHSVIVQGRG